MEVCFIVLLPDDPAEILRSGILIRCLKDQVEGAVVYAAVRETHAWLTETHPSLDGIFTWRDKPMEMRPVLRDFLPDYLVDLDSTRLYRRLKARLHVLDFTIRRKRTVLTWTESAFETCRLFDVADDGGGYRFLPEPLDPNLLPSDFREGFAVIALDTPAGGRPLSDDELVTLAVMTEKPMVITGAAADRPLADRIGQASGCAVFPTCGDLTPAQTASVIGRARAVVAFDSLWTAVAEYAGIPLVAPDRQDLSATAGVIRAHLNDRYVGPAF